jgi:hypothetical protein
VVRDASQYIKERTMKTLRNSQASVILSGEVGQHRGHFVHLRRCGFPAFLTGIRSIIEFRVS